MELSFQTGDIIYVYGEMDEDGFFMGEVDGLRGLVPSNFLTDAPSDYGEGGSSGRGGRGHGPGARGPPPPPRNDPAHNRRKGICFVKPLTQKFLIPLPKPPLLYMCIRYSEKQV